MATRLRDEDVELAGGSSTEVSLQSPATSLMLQLRLQGGRVSQPDPYRVALRVFPQIAMHVFWASVVAVLHVQTGFRLRMPSLIHPLLAGVLGLLLAFRTNQAYERHNSCCKAWAQMHATLLTLARLASHLSNSDFRVYAAILRHLLAFPIALKQHVRGRFDPSEYITTLWNSEVEMMLPDKQPHLWLSASLSMLIRPIKESDDGYGKRLALWSSMDKCLTELHTIMCNLELVVHVPLPESYMLHTTRFVTLWVATLPLVLVGFMRPAMVPIAMLGIAWVLYSTEELAVLMENPFGSKSKQETVPLDDFCDRIIRELKQQVVVQTRLDHHVKDGRWVVKPEDLIPVANPADTEDDSADITDV